MLAHLLEEVFDFRIICRAVLDDVPAELKVFPGEGMIEVDGHLVVRDLQHLAQEAMSLLVLQRYDGILVNVL